MNNKSKEEVMSKIGNNARKALEIIRQNEKEKIEKIKTKNSDANQY